MKSLLPPWFEAIVAIVTSVSTRASVSRLVQRMVGWLAPPIGRDAPAEGNPEICWAAGTRLY